LLAHAGVLALLVGALVSFLAGVEGQIILEEGQFGSMLVMADRNQLSTVWTEHGQGLRSSLTFEPGPMDWPESTTLRLGAVGGVKLEVLKYYRNARTEEQWGEDPSSAGVPAVQLALTTPEGAPMIQQWFSVRRHVEIVVVDLHQVGLVDAGDSRVRVGERIAGDCERRTRCGVY
jgi:hypothetical protein